MSMHLFSPSIYLSMDLTIVLSTDTQKGLIAMLTNSLTTAQRDQIGMSHHHESCIGRFLLLHGWVGCEGSLC
jgi:hypothetical protein